MDETESLCLLIQRYDGFELNASHVEFAIFIEGVFLYCRRQRSLYYTLVIMVKTLFHGGDHVMFISRFPMGHQYNNK